MATQGSDPSGPAQASSWSLSWQSPKLEIGEELINGDTQSISPSEGLGRHTANEGQCRLQLSVAMEGSPEPGPRGQQEGLLPRHPANPRFHGAQHTRL